MTSTCGKKRVNLIVWLLPLPLFFLPPLPVSGQTTGGLTITTDTTLVEDHFGDILIAADNIGLDCDGHKVEGSSSSGIVLFERTGVTVKNCIVSGFSSGFHLSRSSQNTLSDNVAFDNSEGIDLRSSQFNTLVGNTVFGNRNRGISLLLSGNNTITSNNILSNVRQGIMLQGSDDNTVADNTVTDNLEGILLFRFRLNGSDNNTLVGNNVSDNNFGGIRLDSSSDNTLTLNTSSDNGTEGIRVIGLRNALKGNSVSSNGSIGIFIESQGSHIVTGNTVSGNGVGIKVSFSGNNEIINNNFINNPTQALLLGGSFNVFNLPAPRGGNFWDNFETPAEGCDDTDGDGFCDSPFLFAGGQDDLPWTLQNGWDTPQLAIQDLIDEVAALVAASALNQGQGNALTAKLDGAISSLDNGNANAAINQLEAFINQGKRLDERGILLPEEGQVLIDEASSIIDEVSV